MLLPRLDWLGLDTGLELDWLLPKEIWEKSSVKKGKQTFYVVELRHLSWMDFSSYSLLFSMNTKAFLYLRLHSTF